MIPLSQEKSEDLARQAYEAYSAMIEPRIFMDRPIPLPTWEQLKTKDQKAWVAAALRARDISLTEFLLTFESMLELARQQGGAGHLVGRGGHPGLLASPDLEHGPFAPGRHRASAPGCADHRVGPRHAAVIKYLGSKKRLLPNILQQVQSLQDVRSVIDLFSGTSRVGHALKQAGYQVFSNDSASYAHTLATCYVQADRERWASQAELLLADLRKVRGTSRGYFVDTFCRKSRFFQPKNGSRIQAIRNKIASMELPAELEAILLTSLMEAADRVDSTVGVQMAYLKDWAPRSHNDLELRLPDLLPAALAGKGKAHRLEARAAARELSADLAYLDPPYNQHRYRANYHIWDTLVRWDSPPTYGVACKRVNHPRPEGRGFGRP